jgi:hypothetical protein
MAKGRKSSVRYYATKGAYFTHFEGKQIRLADGPDDAPKGKTYLAALARFQELMQVSNADTADQGNTVRVVVDLYGQHLERNGQARSLEIDLHVGRRSVRGQDVPGVEARPRHQLARPDGQAAGDEEVQGGKVGADVPEHRPADARGRLQLGEGPGADLKPLPGELQGRDRTGAEAEPRAGGIHPPGDLAEADRAGGGDQPRLRRHPAVLARDGVPAG